MCVDVVGRLISRSWSPGCHLDSNPRHRQRRSDGLPRASVGAASPPQRHRAADEFKAVLSLAEAVVITDVDGTGEQRAD